MERGHLISVICPSRGRLNSATKMVYSAIDKAAGEIEIIIGMDDDDPAIDIYEDLPALVVVSKRVNTGTTTNLCARKARGGLLLFVGDDCVFQTEGWDEKLQTAITDEVCIFGTNDGTCCNFDHFGATRKAVQLMGQFVTEKVSHYRLDYWIRDVARMACCDNLVQDVVIEHRHHVRTGEKPDAVYLKNEARAAEDHAIYKNSRWIQYLEACKLTAYTFSGGKSPKRIPPEHVRPFQHWPIKYAWHPGEEPFGDEPLEGYLDRAKRREPFYYGATDQWLWRALDRFPIGGKRVLVVGSTRPWYEAIALDAGAASVTTVEFKVPSKEHQYPLVGHTTCTLLTEGTHEKYDAIINVSTAEHTGLGRYRDAILWDADHLGVESLLKVLVPDGKMFFSVPMGNKVLIFNLHRVYGEQAFAELTTGWRVLDKYGFDPREMNQDHSDGGYQPVWVLEAE